MCGIAGILSFNKSKLSSLPVMLNTIKHRGPDDEGCVFFSKDQTLTTYGNDTPKNVRESQLSYSPQQDITALNNDYNIGLGHRRLSILDLSEFGHQPMCDDSENYWIVYNGEIYNYQEIREELAQKGHTFITQTDTEVVLKAYIEWGKKCLHKFNGMWSFVIYNKQTQKVFGARDRFGVKPFYYINNNDYFAFCSEIKGLLQIEGFEKEINPTAVYDFLVLNKTEVDSESFFKNIFELKPAHCFALDYNTQQFSIERYYSLKSTKKWGNYNKQQAAETIDSIKAKITKAIDIRLNADVKTGTCLSGGIDSSGVVTTINQLLSQKKIAQIGEQQEVFTASYPKTTADESYWANLVVKQTKTNWNQTYPTAEVLQQQLYELVYVQDIPFIGSSTFSQFKVMELVNSKNVKVSMDGQGADELFGGYSTHYVASTYNSLKTFSLSNFFTNIGLANGSFSDKKQLFKLPIQKWLINNFPKYYLKKLKQKQPELNHLNSSFLAQHNKRIKIANDKFNSNLNCLLQHQFDTYGLNYLLRTADRNSMHFSVETRVPFADDIELIEELFQISGSYKIRNGKSKFLLRESLKDILPKEIYERTDKIGFATPEKEWFIQLKPFFKELIAKRKNDEFVEWENINSNFEELFENTIKTSTQRLWRLIVFAVWRDVYEI